MIMRGRSALSWWRQDSEGDEELPGDNPPAAPTTDPPPDDD